MNKTNNQEYLVGGFEFFTKEEADAARKEKEGIEYLKQKTDFKDPTAVLNIYNKLLEKGLFQTPVGYCTLHEMQKFLNEQETIDNIDIKNIPINRNTHLVSEEMEAINKITEQPSSAYSKSGKDYKQFYKNSFILNILLIIAIMIMFYITYTGENATVLNYETKIIDRYSKWEQELTEREKALEAFENK